MKKIFLFIITLLLFTGCTSNSIRQEKTKDYYLTYNNYEIKVGNDFKPLLALVGPYNNVREEASTYQDTMANFYEYDDFEIETYFEDGIEKIYSITITNEKIVTNEGIHLNSSYQELIISYGINYSNPYEGIYNYKLNNSNISFIVENDIIVSIRYYLE